MVRCNVVPHTNSAKGVVTLHMEGMSLELDEKTPPSTLLGMKWNADESKQK